MARIFRQVRTISTRRDEETRSAGFNLRILHKEVHVGWNLSWLYGRQVCRNDLGAGKVIPHLNRPGTRASGNVENQPWGIALSERGEDKPSSEERGDDLILQLQSLPLWHIVREGVR